ncbi:MAG: hypothetical protein LBC74_06640 [Planctomycetaceae bacterium]|jgi:hypothetical protein|nr:hypothetical protein [Planctomycetaceae bacterium]
MFDERIFDKAFHTAEIAAMSESESEIYQQNPDNYRTYFTTLEIAKLTGEVKRQLEIARNLKSLNVNNDVIMKATGLSLEEIDNRLFR